MLFRHYEISFKLEIKLFVKKRANYIPAECAECAEGEMIKNECNFRWGLVCYILSGAGFHRLVKFLKQWAVPVH
jgi:hypothetical protein